MSKLQAENIWWPACTMNQTTVEEGDNFQHLLPTSESPIVQHVYKLQQTPTQIIWACDCGRKLIRWKYPREEENQTTSQISRR